MSNECKETVSGYVLEFDHYDADTGTFQGVKYLGHNPSDRDNQDRLVLTWYVEGSKYMWSYKTPDIRSAHVFYDIEHARFYKKLINNYRKKHKARIIQMSIKHETVK